MKTCIFILAALAFCSPAAHSADEFALPPETATLKKAPGFELATTRCMMCHSVDYISTQPPLAAAAWKNVVTKMQSKFGAPIAPADIDALVDYLAKNYGAK